MNIDACKIAAREHEGVRSSVYTDSERLLTCGVGFALETQGANGPIPSTIAQHMCSQVGVDYDALCKGDISLTDAQIEAILDIQMGTAVLNAKQLVPGIDNIPDGVGNAVVDMSFQLGYPRLAGFKKMLAALNSIPPDFNEAASEAQNSKWFTQSGNRSRENVALIRGGI